MHLRSGAPIQVFDLAAERGRRIEAARRARIEHEIARLRDDLCHLHRRVDDCDALSLIAATRQSERTGS